MFERAATETAAAAAGIASAISRDAPASFLADLRAHHADAA